MPDLNFAREITQLFSIGLYKLNPDGTNIMGADGRPAATYTSPDLEGLSQVFTGWSWYAGPHADRPHRRPLQRRQPQPRARLAADAGLRRVHAEHQLPLDQRQDLPRLDDPGARPSRHRRPTCKIALDTLFNHPNVGPFIGKQLIQRLVTSNPSPAYVGRVAAVFNNNGSGVRGDMKAVVARRSCSTPRRAPSSTSASAGKVREPVLRLAHMLRAFNATSTSGRYTGIGLTDDPATTPRPDADVRADGVQLLPSGLRADEQGDHRREPGGRPRCRSRTDVSVAGYMNYMPRLDAAQHDARHPARLQRRARRWPTTPAALVDRMNLLLFSGTMPDA